MKLIKNLATVAIIFIFGFLAYKSCNPTSNETKPTTSTIQEIEESKPEPAPVYSRRISSDCTERFLLEVEKVTKNRYKDILPKTALEEIDFKSNALEQLADDLVKSYLDKLAIRTHINMFTLDTLDERRFQTDSIYNMTIRGQLLTIKN